MYIYSIDIKKFDRQNKICVIIWVELRTSKISHSAGYVADIRCFNSKSTTTLDSIARIPLKW